MLQRLKAVVLSIREWLGERAAGFGRATGSAARIGGERTLSGLSGAKITLAVLGLIVIAGYALYTHPPVTNVGRGEVGVRTNRVTGGVSEWRDGSVVVVPGLHDLRVYSLRDQVCQRMLDAICLAVVREEQSPPMPAVCC